MASKPRCPWSTIRDTRLPDPLDRVKILNQPMPPAFRDSTKVGEQNVYARAKNLVGAGLVGRREAGEGPAHARLRPPGPQRPARLWFNQDERPYPQHRKEV
jgi:hypothetical protein